MVVEAEVMGRSGGRQPYEGCNMWKRAAVEMVTICKEADGGSGDGKRGWWRWQQKVVEGGKQCLLVEGGSGGDSGVCWTACHLAGGGWKWRQQQRVAEGGSGGSNKGWRRVEAEAATMGGVA